MASSIWPGGRAVFTQGGGVQRDPLKIFVQLSVLEAMFAEAGGLHKLCPLLCYSDPEDKLLLSLPECEMTGVTGLKSYVTCKRAMQAVGVG